MWRGETLFEALADFGASLTGINRFILVRIGGTGGFSDESSVEFSLSIDIGDSYSSAFIGGFICLRSVLWLELSLAAWPPT